MILWLSLPTFTSWEERLRSCHEDEAKVHGLFFFFFICKIMQNLSHCCVGGKILSRPLCSIMSEIRDESLNPSSPLPEGDAHAVIYFRKTIHRLILGV